MIQKMLMRIAGLCQYRSVSILMMILVLASSVPQWAEKSPDYHAATVVDVDISVDEGPSRYILTIQDGSHEYAGEYHWHLLHPRTPDDLRVGAQVQYRISGRHLFVKGPNGRELKTRLCAVSGRMTIC